MRKSKDIQKINPILSIFGLVLLLLLSPCKVRNFIQVELGAPQTKVLNKSQTAISQSICHSVELSEAVSTLSKPTIQQPIFPIPETNDFGVSVHLPQHSFPQSPSRSLVVSDVPLYILYQNLQVYS